MTRRRRCGDGRVVESRLAVADDGRVVEGGGRVPYVRSQDGGCMGCGRIEGNVGCECES